MMFPDRLLRVLEGWEKSNIFDRSELKIKTPSGKKLKRDAYTYELQTADSELISKPKRGFERRNLHITHPVPQALLSYEFAKNWRKVQK